MFEWGNFSLRERFLTVAQALEVWEGEHCSLLKAVSSASAGYLQALTQLALDALSTQCFAAYPA